MMFGEDAIFFENLFNMEFEQFTLTKEKLVILLPKYYRINMTFSMVRQLGKKLGWNDFFLQEEVLRGDDQAIIHNYIFTKIS